jgi:hypothetical protein
MSTKNNKRKLDAYRPTFDPHLDIATVVFSHVQCVMTRDSLAQVSKLWRDASKPAAAYPSRFDFDAFPHEEEEEEASDSEEDLWIRPRMDDCTRKKRVLDLMDNDEALSLPYERVVGLLGELAEPLYIYAAFRGSVRLLKWARENNGDWNSGMCAWTAMNGHLPALKYLHENGCPWNSNTCFCAAEKKSWDCLQYAVDNKAPGWEMFAKGYAEHLR